MRVSWELMYWEIRGAESFRRDSRGNPCPVWEISRRDATKARTSYARRVLLSAHSSGSFAQAPPGEAGRTPVMVVSRKSGDSGRGRESKLTSESGTGWGPRLVRRRRTSSGEISFRFHLSCARRRAGRRSSPTTSARNRPVPAPGTDPGSRTETSGAWSWRTWKARTDSRGASKNTQCENYESQSTGIPEASPRLSSWLELRLIMSSTSDFRRELAACERSLKTVRFPSGARMETKELTG